MDLKMVIIALVLGVLFGFALNKAGLTRYTKIVNQFRLTDMAVLKFMMTALVVTMLGVYPMRELGWITFPTIPAGFCPGTAVAGAGEGKWDYIVPGMLGFLVGAVIFGLTYTAFMPQILKIANYGNVALPDLWHISPYLAIFVFTLLALALFYAIDRLGLHRKEKRD
jgi:hypothetical protein